MPRDGTEMIVPFCDLAAVNAELYHELDAAAKRVMHRGQFVLGPEVEAFESEWATYCGRRHAVGVASGLDALQIMLRAYGIRAGDAVAVPSNTFIGTWLAVEALGAEVVPIEPGDDLLIDPGRVRAVEHLDAILAVHLYGRPCDMASLRAIAKPRGIPLLVDAAQAHGLRGGHDLGDCAAFSFYPTKNLGALGDGGAIVTNDPEVAAFARRYRNYGCSAKDVHIEIGENSRLDEMQAAFLRAKLPHLDRFNGRRAANAARYAASCRHASLSLGVNHQFIIQSERRDDLRRDLARVGVGTMVHYPTPPHLQGAFRDRFVAGQFPIAERLAAQVLSLPIGPELTPPQVEHVCKSLQACRP